MKIQELLDLTLREVLENYVAVNNLECGFFYGIFKDEDIEEVFQNYNIDEEYPEAFSSQNLIDDELLVSYDDEIGDYEKLERIMDNLGISKKTNIHKDCENYNSKKDYCLKFFEENVSEHYKVCREYSEFDDKKLSRKWSN